MDKNCLTTSRRVDFSKPRRVLLKAAARPRRDYRRRVARFVAQVTQLQPHDVDTGGHSPAVALCIDLPPAVPAGAGVMHPLASKRAEAKEMMN